MKLKEQSEVVLTTTKKVSCKGGPYLFTKDLRPTSKDPVSAGKNNTEFTSMNLELKFANMAEWKRFRDIVSDT